MISAISLSASQVFKPTAKNELILEKKTADTTMLVQMIKSHNEQGLSILYDNYSTAMYNVLLKIVRSIEVAEDLLQDTFVKIWKNIERFDPVKGTLFTWMLNIARNLAIDYLRSATCKNQLQNVNIELFFLHQNYPANTYSSSNDLDYKDFKQKALQIEKKYAEVIDLICFYGFTQNQTSELLKLPLGTVKTRARKGLRILKTLYQR
jgi:RNA polymerase sigma-70 factor (ECF subfamily)